jgi:hypothetical protein
MKTTIFLAALFLALSASSQAQTLNFKPKTLNFKPETLNFKPETLNYQTAYLITITTNGTTVYKITDKATANQLTGFNTDSLLARSNFFEIRTQGKTIYCEKKHLKHTRNGKMKLKKIRNKF